MNEQTITEKRDLSLRLAEKMRADPQQFWVLVTSDLVLHELPDFKAARQWAKQGTNSLHRGSPTSDDCRRSSDYHSDNKHGEIALVGSFMRSGTLEGLYGTA